MKKYIIGFTAGLAISLPLVLLSYTSKYYDYNPSFDESDIESIVENTHNNIEHEHPLSEIEDLIKEVVERCEVSGTEIIC